MAQEGISAIELDGDSYTVKQSIWRNSYKVFDSAGEEVLRAKQKMFRMKEQFPFVDPDGNEVFEIKAESILDIAGDYTMVDSATGEEIAVLEKKFTLFQHDWAVKTPEGDTVAEIRSRSKLYGVLRMFSDLFQLLPHKYTVSSPEGEELGSIQGKFSLKDTYEIQLNRDAPHREALLAACIAIDALEGN